MVTGQTVRFIMYGETLEMSLKPKTAGQREGVYLEQKLVSFFHYNSTNDCADDCLPWFLHLLTSTRKVIYSSCFIQQHSGNMKVDLLMPVFEIFDVLPMTQWWWGLGGWDGMARTQLAIYLWPLVDAHGVTYPCSKANKGLGRIIPYSRELSYSEQTYAVQKVRSWQRSGP